MKNESTKKEYTQPEAEKIIFSYKDQIVASGGAQCAHQWIGDTDASSCYDAGAVGEN